MITCLALAAVLPASAAPAGPAGNNTDAQPVGQTIDAAYAIVQLTLDPLSAAAKTAPPAGKKIDFNNGGVKAYRALLSAQRNDFKAWLHDNAPKAKVTGNFDIALNAVSLQLNGESLAKIATAPQVKLAQYEGLYHPTADTTVDPDLALIQAVAAWGQGGAAGAGAGVKVAIIDTGIDISHPCFADAGYPAQAQLGDKRFTNNKVIAAKVFNMKTPSRNYTAEALQDHGTHVAGTVACNYNTPASVDGVAIPHGISGVAPAALLGNYNIFPGDVTNAHSEDIMNALEAAYADGFAVANMSLGGKSSGIQDLLAMAVDNLDRAGMVIAVAAGNSGPGHYTVESPGKAARALAAGASTAPHYIATPVTVGGTAYPAAAGDFATVAADLTAPLGAVKDGSSLATACLGLAAGSLTGKIAVVARGDCAFSIKIRNAQAAGAVAALVVNNAAGDPGAMAQDGTPDQPVIPAYMLAQADGPAFAAADGQPATIGASKAYFVTGNGDFMASFSSEGPTDVDFRVKPDVVAPGVNVLSSIPHQFCAAAPCFAFFQGTSMATPHLAGSAAVVLGQHPGWSSAQVRSAIVNTADQGVLKPYAANVPAGDANIIGAGRENLLSAVNAQVALDPVSVSFGAVPSGSGQARAFSVALTNVSGAAREFTLSVGAGGGGVAFSASPATVTLAAGETQAVVVTMTAAKGALAGDHQATLAISAGGAEVAHAVVYVFVK